MKISDHSLAKAMKALRDSPDSKISELINEALAAWSDQFDGDPATDISVNGGDLVDWFADWRLRMREALKAAG
jgi:hypothetical protein